jgi:hypothetical protein
MFIHFSGDAPLGSFYLLDIMNNASFFTGASTQDLHLSSSTTPFFVMGIFEIRCHELFAQAGFESQSS